LLLAVKKDKRRSKGKNREKFLGDRKRENNGEDLISSPKNPAERDYALRVIYKSWRWGIEWWKIRRAKGSNFVLPFVNS